MEIQGTIVHVLPLQSGVGKQSGKEWKKQEFVIETAEQFPKRVCICLWGDLIDRTNLSVGEDITAQIDIESREFNGRWYTEIKAWRIDRGFITLQAQLQGYAQPQVPMTPTAQGYAQPQQGYYPPQPQQGGYQAPAPQEPAGDIYLPF